MLYHAMGARDASLAAALAYSTLVFLGAIPLWLFNSLAAIIRGTGNMIVPMVVSTVGAIVLLPLSPALIMGWGPLPHLGIIGGATAVVSYYVAGSAIYVAFLWSGRGVLKPPARLPRLAWGPTREILRVGAISALISVSTNLTIATATGFVGAYGPAAIAGYGTGSRLEYLLVPLVFGLGAPLGAMVGTAIGAGRRARALNVAWTGAILAGIVTEAIGIAGALAPNAWLALFGTDPAMLATGAQYLRHVGPFYGFFGAGLALYFASQGAGRLAWPLLGAVLRVIVAIGGGFLALRFNLGLPAVFLALGLGLIFHGVVNAIAIACGAWFKGRGEVRAKPGVALTQNAVEPARAPNP